MRIMFVGRDPGTQDAVSVALKSPNLIIDEARSFDDAIGQAQMYDYETILVDTTSMGPSGFTFIRSIRERKIGSPVLVLSRDGNVQTKVRAFELGADDYVLIPFDAEELLARVYAVIRRSKGFSQPVLQLGPLHIDIGKNEALVDGRKVNLTGKEYSILELLVLHRGNAISKESFLNHLYSGLDEPEAKIIDVFICKLRKKLAEAGAKQLIETVWGRGYLVRDPAARQPIHAAPVPASVPGKAESGMRAAA